MMHNIKMQITPYADFIPVMRQLVDQTATIKTIKESNLQPIAWHLIKTDATLHEITKRNQKPVFELFIKNMSIDKFVRLGALTSSKQPEHPFEKICIVERDNEPQNDGYDAGVGFGAFAGIHCTL